MTPSDEASVVAGRVRGFRIHRHRLRRRASARELVSVAGDVAGIHAQVASAAQLSLASRVHGVRPEDVERALWTDRRLVKTWLMRGTLHLVPAETLPLFLGGLRREGLRREKQWMARQGLREADFPRMTEAVVEALASGPLTRKRLADAVADLVGAQARPWVEHAWGGILRLACLEGRVCFGPDAGREVTFVRRADWLHGWKEPVLDAAEEELARRYLRAYGPATPADFAYWTGMRIGAAKRIWGRLEDELVPMPAAGTAASLLAEDAETLANTSPPDGVVRLLPFFDVYLLGHRDKGHLVEEARYKQVYRRAGWVSPTLLLDGGVVGVWSHKRRGDRLRVEIEPFQRGAPLSSLEAGLQREADRLGRFFGAVPEVVLREPPSKDAGSRGARRGG